MQLSDSFNMLDGRPSYVSRHRRAGYSSSDSTNKKRTSTSAGRSLDQDREWYLRYRLPYQLVRHLRNANRRSPRPRGHDDNIKVSSGEIGQGRIDVSEREKPGQGRQDRSMTHRGQ